MSEPADTTHPWLQFDSGLLWITYPANIELSQIDACEASMQAILSRNPGPFTVLSDAREVKSVDAVTRRRFAKMTEDFNRYEGRMLGSAVVASSTLLQGALTAIRWFARRPYPERVFTDLASAETWVRQMLSDA